MGFLTWPKLLHPRRLGIGLGLGSRSKSSVRVSVRVSVSVRVGVRVGVRVRVRVRVRVLGFGDVLSMLLASSESTEGGGLDVSI